MTSAVLVVLALAAAATAEPRRLLPSFAAQRNADYVGGGGPDTPAARHEAEIAEMVAKTAKLRGQAGSLELRAHLSCKAH